jgi:lipopolysaccharide/colanic/teichoic acid biosynthesis glycosyltransferase
MKSTYPVAKRAFDIVASGVGLAFLSPVLVVLAAVVWVTSEGSVLFVQERMGRGGRPMNVLKFRTMRVGTGGPQVTAAGDGRITTIGKILRRYKLDELPQLLNVFVGDMSLVGPRPEVRKYVELFWKDYQDILAVRPGITDYASLRYRNEEAILAASPDPEKAYVEEVLPAKIALYHEYLRRMSFATDLQLILRTLTEIVH